MKRILILTAVLTLSACSSMNTSSTFPKKQADIPTVPDFEVRALNRNEVIQATDHCLESNMRPFVEYISQKTPYGRVQVPVNVHCNPKRNNDPAPANVNVPVNLRVQVQ